LSGKRVVQMVRLQNAVIRRWLVPALLCLLAGSALADGEEAGDGPHTRLAEVGDLQVLGHAARAAGVPILLMFASEECPY